MRAGISERAILKMMESPILAYTPIYNEINRIKNDGIDLYIVYGDRDWIDTSMGDLPISMRLKEEGEKVYYVEDAEHQFFLDNPDGVLDTLDDCMSD